MTEDPTYATRAEIDILGKVSRWSGKVSAPIGAVPIKTMTDEIESLSSTKQEFTEI